MLIIVGVLLTLLTPFIVFGMGYLRVRPGFQLLIISITTLTALVLFLSNVEILPISISLADLSTTENYLGSSMLLVDIISWPLVIAILTLVVSTFLIDIVHLDNLSPKTWAFIQFFGGLGIVAVLSGNPLTILIAWSMIDITEFIAFLRIVPRSRDRENIVISLSFRISGIILVISAIIIAHGMGILLSYNEIPNPVSALLILAAGLRLGVLPPTQVSLENPNRISNAITTIRIITSISGIVIGVRAANSGVLDEWFLIIILLFTLVVTLSAINWIQVENKIQGLSYWILGYGSFSLAAAAQGFQPASLAWALAMVFSGALLFKFSQSNRWMILLVFLGVIGISTLPLTPTWEGSVQIFSLPWVIRTIFIIIQALMIVGYVRFTMQSTEKEHGIEKWELLVYTLGLVILPIGHFCLYLFSRIPGLNNVSFQSSGWWSGLISTGMSTIILIAFQDKLKSPPLYGSKINTLFIWISRFFWWGYRSLGRVLYYLTRILEGDGSVLWAILILLLLTVTISLWGNGEIFEL